MYLLNHRSKFINFVLLSAKWITLLNNRSSIADGAAMCAPLVVYSQPIYSSRLFTGVTKFWT